MDITEVTTALSELSVTITNKANVLNCVVQGGQVQNTSEETIDSVNK